MTWEEFVERVNNAKVSMSIIYWDGNGVVEFEVKVSDKYREKWIQALEINTDSKLEDVILILKERYGGVDAIYIDNGLLFQKDNFPQI